MYTMHARMHTHKKTKQNNMAAIMVHKSKQIIRKSKTNKEINEYNNKH